jgi:serine/threonine protein kinase
VWKGRENTASVIYKSNIIQLNTMNSSRRKSYSKNRREAATALTRPYHSRKSTAHHTKHRASRSPRVDRGGSGNRARIEYARRSGYMAGDTDEPFSMASSNANVENFPTVANRLSRMDNIKRHLQADDSEEWCMSSKTKPRSAAFANGTMIGNGSYGNVYAVTGPPSLGGDFAVKETFIATDEFHAFRRGKSDPAELYYSRVMSTLVSKLISPHVPLTGPARICGDCNVLINTGDPDSPTRNNESRTCFTTVLEKFDGDLLEYLREAHYGINGVLYDDVLANLMFQVLHVLGCAQSEFGFIHGDIKLQNLLYRKVPAGGYWHYRVNGTNYFVPNIGVIIALSDYGTNAEMFRPNYSLYGDYGMRQYHIYKLPSGSLGATPLMARYTIQRNDTNNPMRGFVRVPYIDDSIPPRFARDINTEPVSNVDLDNMVEFPHVQFAWDLFDVINMFTGGPLVYQAEHMPDGSQAMHPSLQLDDGEFTQSVIDISNTPFPQVYSLTNLKPLYMYNALSLIELLYKQHAFRKRPVDEPLLETYEYPENPQLVAAEEDAY